MKTYRPNEFAKEIGVTVKTLQRWDTEGKLRANWTPSGRRYYTQDQLDAYFGKAPSETDQRKAVIYARVSSRSQQKDLENQIEFLRNYANGSGQIIDEIVSDTGSGLNYNRQNWNSLLDRCQNGEIKTIFVVHKDRFTRFGFDWFERFLKKFDCDIVVVNNEKLSPEAELINDLISIVHVFSCRIYGLRKYKAKLKEDGDLHVKGVQD